jgi:hypothetical protein
MLLKLKAYRKTHFNIILKNPGDKSAEEKFKLSSCGSFKRIPERSTILTKL